MTSVITNKDPNVNQTIRNEMPQLVTRKEIRDIEYQWKPISERHEYRIKLAGSYRYLETMREFVVLGVTKAAALETIMRCLEDVAKEPG